jgi:spore maturation protein CgeB
MEDQILKTRKVRESSFSAIYVWIDKHGEGFETYSRKHMMLTLSWAYSNENLKEQLRLRTGDIHAVTMQLISNFKKDFKGNISYLEEIYGTEILQKMIQAIVLFIKDSVEAYTMIFPLFHTGNDTSN